MSSVRKVTGRRGSAGQARRATPDGHHPAIQGASRCLHPAPAPGADPRQIEVSGNLPAGSPGRAARWLAGYRVPGTRDRKTDGKPERSCRVAPVRMHKWFSLRRGRQHSPPRRCCSLWQPGPARLSAAPPGADAGAVLPPPASPSADAPLSTVDGTGRAERGPCPRPSALQRTRLLLLIYLFSRGGTENDSSQSARRRPPLPRPLKLS